MKKYKTGVVIGKFYPPHLGHKYLIDVAKSYVQHLTVILCWKKEHYIPGNLRVNFLKEIHPDVKIIGVEDKLDDNDTVGWAKATIELLGYIPDIVCTSEDYGDAYAKAMGCVHIQVDKSRITIPCSGTLIRNDPLNHLEYLEPCVRAYFVKRICVLGAESTGTTTLANALAQYYKTIWVPEYGRDYSIEKLKRSDANEWKTSEFVVIANEQLRQEDEAAKCANKVLICDTDAFATSIWHYRYMNCRSKDVEEIASKRKYDLYILTDADIPFVQDGTRDGEHIRLWMHNFFKDELTRLGKKYIIVSGGHENRMNASVKEIDKIIK